MGDDRGLGDPGPLADGPGPEGGVGGQGDGDGGPEGQAVTYYCCKECEDFLIEYYKALYD